MWLLELSGEADIGTVALLRQELALLAATDRSDAEVDVTHLTFCDVASAHMILTARRTTPVTVRGATGSVKWMFNHLDALLMQRQTGRRASGRSGPLRTREARAWAS